MKAKLQDFLKGFDLEGGVWVGLYTFTMIGLTIAAFILKRDLPPGAVSTYAVVIGGFVVHRTAVKVFGDDNAGQ